MRTTKIKRLTNNRVEFVNNSFHLKPSSFIQGGPIVLKLLTGGLVLSLTVTVSIFISSYLDGSMYEEELALWLGFFLIIGVVSLGALSVNRIIDLQAKSITTKIFNFTLHKKQYNQIAAVEGSSSNYKPVNGIVTALNIDESPVLFTIVNKKEQGIELMPIVNQILSNYN